MSKELVKKKNEVVKKKKNAIGAPTKYDPSYCEMLIEHMASGLSYESFAGVIGTHRTSLYNWEKEYPVFFDAKKEGAEKNLLFWEKTGQKGLWDKVTYDDRGRPIAKKTLNSTVWIFNMKNRHKWKDRQEVNNQIEVIDPEKEKIKKMSDKELKEYIESKEHD